MFRALPCAALLLALCPAVLAAADEPKARKEPATRPAAQEARRRPSDVVFILIETSDIDKESLAELQRIYDMLRKLDKNGNGKIDPSEIKAVREELVTDRVDYIFKKLDANGDGKISRDEAKGRVKEHFDRLDANGDGFISRAELRAAIEGHVRAAAKEAPRKE